MNVAMMIFHQRLRYSILNIFIRIKYICNKGYQCFYNMFILKQHCAVTVFSICILVHYI